MSCQHQAAESIRASLQHETGPPDATYNHCSLTWQLHQLNAMQSGVLSKGQPDLQQEQQAACQSAVLLQGKRIGIISSIVDNPNNDPEIIAKFNQAVADLRAGGELVRHHALLSLVQTKAGSYKVLLKNSIATEPMLKSRRPSALGLCNHMSLDWLLCIHDSTLGRNLLVCFINASCIIQRLSAASWGCRCYCCRQLHHHWQLPGGQGLVRVHPHNQHPLKWHHLHHWRFWLQQRLLVRSPMVLQPVTAHHSHSCWHSFLILPMPVQLLLRVQGCRQGLPIAVRSCDQLMQSCCSQGQTQAPALWCTPA